VFQTIQDGKLERKQLTKYDLKGLCSSGRYLETFY